MREKKYKLDVKLTDDELVTLQQMRDAIRPNPGYPLSRDQELREQLLVKLLNANAANFIMSKKPYENLDHHLFDHSYMDSRRLKERERFRLLIRQGMWLGLVMLAIAMLIATAFYVGRHI